MKKRILVVDDDGMNLARTKIILGKDEAEERKGGYGSAGYRYAGDERYGDV